MKNVLKTFMAAAVTAVILIHNANAQSAVAGLSENNAPDSQIFTTDEQKDKNALSDIHPRAVKDFQKSFKDITNEQWSRLDDGYIASFTTDSVRMRIGYNRKGSREYTMRYYGEKKLPHEVRDIVKSVYYDYTILGVSEISFDDQPVYLVYIQDETHLKTVGVYDGEMQVIRNYKRG
jgi:hypothetical protein